ncbi:MAG: glycosyltransferase family 39 protein [Capsulimonas sp.]|uniref:ArnT family glycosyltransferase n=1 Tax=Capsulimonas sp. TaxID=2494211 RepID=UPI0032657F55
MKRDNLFNALTVAIVVVFAILALYRLNNAYFWSDEAYVAFMASNFLKTGHLSCWDGRNLYVTMSGSLLHPGFTQPAQFSLDIMAAALSFKLFGISTWSARLPSVIFGVAGLIAFNALLRMEFPKRRALTLFALALLAFSVQYLLNARTARYYTEVSFFSIGAYYCYRRFCADRSWKAALGLSVWAILLFYGHLLGGLAFILALAVTHLLFHLKAFTKPDWTKIGVAALIFLVATLPFVVANHLWAYGRTPQAPSAMPTRLWLIWLNLRDLNLTNCFPWTCAIGLIFLMRYRRNDEGVAPVATRIVEWGAIILCYAIFQGMLCAPSQVSWSVAIVRYFSPILPFLTGLCGVFVWMVYRISKPTSIGLFLLVICTNLTTLTPLSPRIAPATDNPDSLLPAYVVEITHPYETADAAVSRFLRNNAHRDDVVTPYPNSHATTMDFYDGDFIRTGALLDDRCALPKETVNKLHAPLRRDDTYPDWIVFYGPEIDQPSTLKYFCRPHLVDGKMISFHYPLAARLNVFGDESNRSELIYHSFKPLKVTDPKEAVYIYRLQKH